MPGERAVIVGASRRGERHLDHLVDLHGDLGARILPVEREVMGHILLIDQLDRHRITGVGLELRVDLPLNLAAHPAVDAHIGFQGILDLSAHRRHRLRRIITARRIVLAPGCGQQKKSRHPNKVPGKTSDRGESIRSFDSHDYLLKKLVWRVQRSLSLFLAIYMPRMVLTYYILDGHFESRVGVGAWFRPQIATTPMRQVCQIAKRLQLYLVEHQNETLFLRAAAHKRPTYPLAGIYGRSLTEVDF